MEVVMDWTRVEGNWKQVKGKVKEKWGKLTDDDLTAINSAAINLKARSESATAYPRIRPGRKLTTGTGRNPASIGRTSRVLITNSPRTNLTKPLQYDPKI